MSDNADGLKENCILSICMLDLLRLAWFLRQQRRIKGETDFSPTLKCRHDVLSKHSTVSNSHTTFHGLTTTLVVDRCGSVCAHQSTVPRGRSEQLTNETAIARKHVTHCLLDFPLNRGHSQPSMWNELWTHSKHGYFNPSFQENKLDISRDDARKQGGRSNKSVSLSITWGRLQQLASENKFLTHSSATIPKTGDNYYCRWHFEFSTLNLHTPNTFE